LNGDVECSSELLKPQYLYIPLLKTRRRSYQWRDAGLNQFSEWLVCLFGRVSRSFLRPRSCLQITPSKCTIRRVICKSVKLKFDPSSTSASVASLFQRILFSLLFWGRYFALYPNSEAGVLADPRKLSCRALIESCSSNVPWCNTNVPTKQLIVGGTSVFLFSCRAV